MYKKREQQRIKNQRRYIVARRKRLQRKRKKMFASLLVFMFVWVIILSLLLFRNISEKNMELLEGIWVYDEYTQYEFNGDGQGCLCLEDLHYEYKYTVKQDSLRLNFKDDSIRDCSYTFKVNGDKLTLIGKEGTVGGKYALDKIK